MTKTWIVSGFVVVILILVLFLLPSQPTAWQQAQGYRWRPLQVTGRTQAGFERLPPTRTGITFTNTLSRDQIKENRVRLNGSGVAIGDIDADGLADLYFCAQGNDNKLYKNLGNWKFEDITATAGVAFPNQFSTGATFADVDGDGDLDLLVTSIGGPVSCFRNDGQGVFEDITQEVGLPKNTGAHTMTLGDIDDDGDLDLYISNYKKVRAEDIYTPFELAFDNIVRKVRDSYEIASQFRKHYTLELRGSKVLRFESGDPDFLLINDGGGHFTPAAFTDGTFSDEDGEAISEPLDWGLMARFHDVDGDLDPDLYVCNDFESPDRLWINDGTGRFRAAPRLALRNTSNSSMSVDFSDVNRDGAVDFFVADMLSREHQKRKTQMLTMVPIPPEIGEIDNRPQFMKNTLFLNRNDGTFAEIGQLSGVHASEWSWSSLFFDVDLDGYEDLVISNGHFFDAQDLDTRDNIRLRISSILRDDYRNVVFMYPRLELPNVAFRNRGDLTFEDVSERWGFDEPDISHGAALGDLDNDGDLDIVMNRLDKPAAVFRNETSAARIAVRLQGKAPNTQAIGAKITVSSGRILQTKEVIAGGSYLSHSDHLYVFAAPVEEDSTRIEVTWRNGSKSWIREVKSNCIYEISEADAKDIAHVAHDTTTSAGPIFEDVSHLLGHTHHEEPFDDFARQPLLPHRLSQTGPGAAWHDLDSDGDDDLLISSGKGGNLAYFRNDQGNGFHPVLNSITAEKSRRDQTGILGVSRKDGATSLLVSHSNYEDNQPAESLVRRFDLAAGRPAQSQAFTTNKSSAGHLAVADYDLDGDLDLFVAGRSLPGSYPEPASSLLFQNADGAFVRDEKTSTCLQDIGLVNGAVFSDFDADGDPDLILAIEWGPITVLRNSNGAFHDATQALGLAELRGWWNGVTTGDLNADGKLDIIATNWGNNTKYSSKKNHPRRVYYGDFDNNGLVDILESYFDERMQAYVPERGLQDLTNSSPYVIIRTPTNKKFASSSIRQIMGGALDRAKSLEANEHSQMLFLNRGETFEPHPLPVEAQFAPAFYVGVSDFDGDGHEDVFISQNFFATHLETPRSDAGRGLWLKGDGAGQLHAVPGDHTGIKVYGEQRGAALGDYNQDGRVDIVVTQNANITKLYKNVGGKPGLRVRLVGTEGNPQAIGATIRLAFADDEYGPAREIHAGSGYLSQDSAIQVLGKSKEPEAVWVRWPGGKITETSIPPHTQEVVIDVNGMVDAVSVRH